MSVLAVVNRKGGSGKSTLATHVAAWLSGQGLPTVLADVDRQQSTQTWLRRRAQQAGVQRTRLSGWSVDPRNVVRPPTTGGHVVLDTPGGLRGFDLARVVMYADAILMPVCNSVFDRESAAECVAELRTLPRVASGRCRLAAVGMRIDARTKADGVLRAWADALQLPFVGVLRDTQAYVRCIEDGLTLFDLPAAKVAQDLAQWQSILDWLAPLVQPDAAAEAQPAGQTIARALPPDRRAPSAPRAVPPAAATGLPARVAPTPQRPMGAAAAPTRLGRLLGALAIPRFLQRDA